MWANVFFALSNHRKVLLSLNLHEIKHFRYFKEPKPTNSKLKWETTNKHNNSKCKNTKYIAAYEHFEAAIPSHAATHSHIPSSPFSIHSLVALSRTDASVDEFKTNKCKICS